MTIILGLAAYAVAVGIAATILDCILEDSKAISVLAIAWPLTLIVMLVACLFYVIIRFGDAFKVLITTLFGESKHKEGE